MHDHGVYPVGENPRDPSAIVMGPDPRAATNDDVIDAEFVAHDDDGKRDLVLVGALPGYEFGELRPFVLMTMNGKTVKVRAEMVERWQDPSTRDVHMHFKMTDIELHHAEEWP